MNSTTFRLLFKSVSGNVLVEKVLVELLMETIGTRLLVTVLTFESTIDEFASLRALIN